MTNKRILIDDKLEIRIQIRCIGKLYLNLAEMHIPRHISIIILSNPHVHVAIITGAKTKETAIRYQNLGIEDIHLGCQVKIGIYQKILQQQELKNEEVLYMGDDIPDWEIMQQVGLPCCPADAAIEIKEISRYISPHKGGDGCVRDVIEQILRAQDLWMTDKTAFGW